MIRPYSHYWHSLIIIIVSLPLITSVRTLFFANICLPIHSIQSIFPCLNCTHLWTPIVSVALSQSMCEIWNGNKNRRNFVKYLQCWIIISQNQIEFEFFVSPNDDSAPSIMNLWPDIATDRIKVRVFVIIVPGRECTESSTVYQNKSSRGHIIFKWIFPS